MKKKRKYILLCLVFFGCGILLICLSTITSSADNVNNYCLVREAKNNYIIVTCNFRQYYIYIEGNKYQEFDIIKINGAVESLSFKKYESQFDFTSYLENKGCYHSISATEIKDTFLFPVRLKNIRDFILAPFDENTMSICYKLLFNQSFDKDWENMIYRNNLSYVFFLSSFQLYFFLGIIEKILIRYISKSKTRICVILILTFLIPLANYKKSLIKILILKILSYLEYKKEKINFSAIDKIMITWEIILFVFPCYIQESSFWISLMTALFLYYLSCGAGYITKKYKSLYFSIMIFLLLLPLWINSSGTVNLISVFLIFFFEPLILVYLFLLLVSSLCRFAFIINFISKAGVNFITYIDKCKIYLVTGKMNLIILIFYYLILFIGAEMMEKKVYKRIPGILSLLCLLIVFSAAPVENQFTYEVDFINVGQGDSILIRERNNVVMIDTGGIKNNNIAENTLIPFMHKKKICKIDTLFITHDDYDHMGAKEELLNNFKVKEVKGNSFSYYKLGNIELTNLNYDCSAYDNENDKSLVLYMNLYGTTFLFMGDASVTVEKKIAEEYPLLTAKYLKVGHHGSNTSTCEEFLDIIKPEVAVISCGINNYYGHPHQSVLNMLEERNIKIRRTDTEGTISIKGMRI